MKAKGSIGIRVVAGVVVVLALVGFRAWSRANKTVVDEDGVYMVSKDDAKMNAAIEKSRQTAAQFIEHLAKPGPGEEGFTVKVAVTEGDRTEYFWLDKVTFDGAFFHGLIDNDPVMVRRVKLGQKWKCNRSEIADWMYVKDGVLVGGESIRVMRDKMSRKERDAFDKDAPFEVR